MGWTKIDVHNKEFEKAKGAMDGIELQSYNFETTPVVLDRLDTTQVLSKYRVKDGNIELQIFYPDENLDRPWNVSFAHALYASILQEFGLEHYPDRVLVEFVPEVNGWYVVIRNVAYIREPDPERLSRMINRAPLV